MGLAIISIGFYLALFLFLAGLLISALTEKDYKKRKVKITILFILALPLLQFIVGISAYEFYYKRQAGFHFSQNYTSLSFQTERSFLIEPLNDSRGLPFEILDELKLGGSDFIEFSTRSGYTRVSSSDNENCIWGKNATPANSHKRHNHANIDRCFNFKPVDSTESRFGFKTEINRSIYFLPISRERTILFENVSNKEVARFESYRFYYFYGSVFGGRKYPYAGGSSDLEFFYQKLIRPWE